MVRVYYVASVSFGKDSLAMLLRLIEEDRPLDEVVFYNTGMEFRSIYALRDRIVPDLHAQGIRYTELKPENPFLYDMFERPVQERSGGTHCGYGWCGGPVRWGTAMKRQAIRRHKRSLGETTDYVGIAADETARFEKERSPGKVLPLVEWGMTEADCLRYCRDRGYSWDEGGIDLYDVLSRVSCWCCRNKNLKELKQMYYCLPEYWERLRELQARLPPMKQTGSIFELEERFKREGEQMKL